MQPCPTCLRARPSLSLSSSVPIPPTTSFLLFEVWFTIHICMNVVYERYCFPFFSQKRVSLRLLLSSSNFERKSKDSVIVQPIISVIFEPIKIYSCSILISTRKSCTKGRILDFEFRKKKNFFSHIAFPSKLEMKIRGEVWRLSSPCCRACQFLLFIVVHQCGSAYNSIYVRRKFIRVFVSLRRMMMDEHTTFIDV